MNKRVRRLTTDMMDNLIRITDIMSSIKHPYLKNGPNDQETLCDAWIVKILKKQKLIVGKDISFLLSNLNNVPESGIEIIKKQPEDSKLKMYNVVVEILQDYYTYPLQGIERISDEVLIEYAKCWHKVNNKFVIQLHRFQAISIMKLHSRFVGLFENLIPDTAMTFTTSFILFNINTYPKLILSSTYKEKFKIYKNIKPEPSKSFILREISAYLKYSCILTSKSDAVDIHSFLAYDDAKNEPLINDILEIFESHSNNFYIKDVIQGIEFLPHKLMMSLYKNYFTLEQFKSFFNVTRTYQQTLPYWYYSIPDEILLDVGLNNIPQFQYKATIIRLINDNPEFCESFDKSQLKKLSLNDWTGLINKNINISKFFVTYKKRGDTFEKMAKRNPKFVLSLID